MNIYGDVLEDFTTESYTNMTFLDLSTAFDKVDRNILIIKLKTEYDVSEIAQNCSK